MIELQLTQPSKTGLLLLPTDIFLNFWVFQSIVFKHSFPLSSKVPSRLSLILLIAITRSELVGDQPIMQVKRRNK